MTGTVAPSAPVFEQAGEVARLVDHFRVHQERDGSVPEASSADIDLLRAVLRAASGVLAALGAQRQFEALRDDTEDWITAGLDTPPDFGRTREQFVPPAEGKHAFFVGCALTTNSAPPVGRRLECFLVQRREPRELQAVGAAYPHPKNNCQSVVLLSASAGFKVGNCLVFFPENVPSTRPVTAQSYAMFFFSKFRRIHQTLAVPPAHRIMVGGSVPGSSTGLSPDICYDARSVWGYLHDYHHHQGLWPLDEHVALKMNWFVGLLEETKVDAKTIITATDDDRIPFRDEQIAMILLERLVRYPRSRVATRNFDAGTGVLLYSWFRERGGIRPAGSHLLFDRSDAISALRQYVTEIEDLEARVTSPEAYRSEALAFVRRYLPEGQGRDRFAFTTDQRRLLGSRDPAEDDPLLFGDGEM